MLLEPALDDAHEALARLRPRVDAARAEAAAAARAKAAAAAAAGASSSSSASPSSSRFDRANGAKNEGNAAMARGDHAGAHEAYTRALELDPSNLAARNNRAFAAMKLARFGEAERDASLVLAREPHNAKALDRLVRQTTVTS